MEKNRGISLIVLLITILVMAILITTVVLSMKDQNLTESAFEATFREKIESYRIDIDDYVSKREFEEGISYNKDLLRANLDCIMYDNKIIEGNIFSILNSMTEEDSKLFVINNGKLVYSPLSDDDFDEQEFNIACKAGLISYKSDNLIGYYEAGSNVGGAFSNTAIGWKDLTSNNNNATIIKNNTNDCWTGTTFKTDLANFSAVFPINFVNNSFTIEVVYKDINEDSTELLQINTDSSAIKLDKIPATKSKDKIFKAIYVYDSTKNSITTYNISGASEQTQNVTLNTVTSIEIPKTSNKEYYSIRIYNGIISNVVRDSNTNIDVLRFEKVN